MQGHTSCCCCCLPMAFSNAAAPSMDKHLAIYITPLITWPLASISKRGKKSPIFKYLKNQPDHIGGTCFNGSTVISFGEKNTHTQGRFKIVVSYVGTKVF